MNSKYEIDEHAVMTILYGSIQKLCNDRTYYYEGVSKDYSYFTDDGKVAIMKFMETVAPMILEVEKKKIDDHAKAQTMEQLQKVDIKEADPF
ncbi:uncharacterized protein METZ01_LOCUS181108 [marine metagenome]|uniref:Uncharacterized protein n=1 Tax=marine metagenome TaxID=408172 RepID=A0A382CR03_9ZZZZ